MFAPTAQSPSRGLVVEASPLSQFLAQQQTLDRELETPVARYSEQHADLAAAGEESFRTLIPLSAPGEGQQYAFEVDMDRCTGCKACVAGCHSMNGLREEETWRDVGLVHGYIEYAKAYQQTITTACHHCSDPACLNGCPVLAYEKDPITGIVRHLDDQCIGCQYCVLKCPYDVPKYNPDLGIVRKCDMCHNRLSAGEAPACVASCPTEAIRITVVDQPRREAPGEFLPGAPEPSYTLPTTRYVTQRERPGNVAAADADSPKLEHAHYPLVFMLTLTQAGVGGLLAAVGWQAAGSGFGARLAATAGLILLFAGLGASVLHLGRPLGAWRAFLGLRKSWLSREIVLFGGFAPLALGFTATLWGLPVPAPLAAALPLLVVPAGLAAVFSSIMIYVDTHRANWRLPITASEFGGSVTAIGLGTASTTAAFAARGSAFLALLWAAVLLAITVAGWRRQRSPRGRSPESLRGELLRGPLRPRVRLRMACHRAALVLIFTGMLVPAVAALAYPVALALSLAGELLGRALYFQSVIAPKMPGGFRR